MTELWESCPEVLCKHVCQACKNGQWCIEDEENWRCGFVSCVPFRMHLTGVCVMPPRWCRYAAEHIADYAARRYGTDN